MATAVVGGSWDEDRECDEDYRITLVVNGLVRGTGGFARSQGRTCDVRRETRNEDRNCILSRCRMAREVSQHAVVVCAAQHEAAVPCPVRPRPSRGRLPRETFVRALFEIVRSVDGLKTKFRLDRAVAQ